MFRKEMIVQMRTLTILIAMMLFAVILFPSAADAGAFNSRRPTVSIKEIYNDFDSYNGRIVRIKAKVVEQDERGLGQWLILNDGTGVIQVVLWVYGISFDRQAVGKEIEVIGKVGTIEDRNVIKATMVRVGNTRYRRTGNTR
ncbi:MAG: hypothetical protein CVV64_05045 [Candidatus Wallbacteria bacterium HGW-Wallbacteria-1]|jgi:hypothetical protein|uniref:OB domain-containing protein n=1 Tax=Candidatus Wallbacteria bacterium HGW-Wallbacteria-1 TaxID=2013854 RepID=A0A2N1PS18_9BACT|nr:MAG: hypothetical protein CVV64_05045 [Candidatus Wallbacteria bacterium HGW-Wallbacteria-1]